MLKSHATLMTGMPQIGVFVEHKVVNTKQLPEELL